MRQSLYHPFGKFAQDSRSGLVASDRFDLFAGPLFRAWHRFKRLDLIWPLDANVTIMNCRCWAVKFLFGTVFTALFWLVLRVAMRGGSTLLPYATSIILSLFLVLIGLLLARRAVRRVRRNIF